MQTYILKPLWNSSNLIFVSANIDIKEDIIFVEFNVKEPIKCFCQNKEQDGEAVWQDSCVEIFLKMFNASCYANFEFNSKGICYCACGESRQARTEISKEEYSYIKRIADKIVIEDDCCKWSLSVQIPLFLLGVPKDFKQFKLEGNLYKCADTAEEPNYLSAFPISTTKPDFHRPDYFCRLF